MERIMRFRKSVCSPELNFWKYKQGLKLEYSSMNIYVGNLPYNTTEHDIRAAFEAYGEVSSAAVIMDRMTGKSKGFGFVEMPSDEQGQQAIDGLNGSELDGRNLKVNEARPREDRRPPRSGGGGGGYGGGGGGGGGGRSGGGGGGYGGGGGGGRGRY